MAAYGRAADVSCTECDAVLMQVYSIYGGWLWIAVYGQEQDVPAPQCPKVPGLYGVGHGAHSPNTA